MKTPMKKKYISYALALVMLAGACEQETIDLQEPSCEELGNCPPGPVCPTGATAGTASFAKFVAMGNSYVAGFQAGALFNDGQGSSLPKLLAKQFECTGGPTSFNQPDINSVNGYNPLSSIPGVITLGRNILFDPDGPAGPRTAAPYPAGFPGSAVTCPSAVNTPALPAPYNTADAPAAFAGNKAALNNFGVPLIFLGQALTPDTGNPSSPYFNGLWARFASQPGVKSIVEDALGAGGSFYLIWLGFDDVLLYAATGADGTYPMTTEGAFTAQYNGMITTMLTANPAFKGVVGNIPNFTSLPYFFTVRWNAITLDAAKATALQAGLADNYNAFLNGMVGLGVITAAEKDKRLLSYVAGANGVLMVDEELTDLSAYTTGPYAGLAPYAQARQAKSTDLVPLAAGSVLGTCNGGNANAIFGVSYPVADKYILTQTETTLILTRTAAFNATISAAVAGSSNRLALADVNKAYGDFVTAQLYVIDGVAISPSFAPPTGAYSEDGLHPNSRGYAFTANVFIDAINAKFTSTVPKIKLTAASGTKLPVNP